MGASSANATNRSHVCSLIFLIGNAAGRFRLVAVRPPVMDLIITLGGGDSVK